MHRQGHPPDRANRPGTCTQDLKWGPIHKTPPHAYPTLDAGSGAGANGRIIVSMGDDQKRRILRGTDGDHNTERAVCSSRLHTLVLERGQVDRGCNANASPGKRSVSRPLAQARPDGLFAGDPAPRHSTPTTMAVGVSGPISHPTAEAACPAWRFFCPVPAEWPARQPPALRPPFRCRGTGQWR